MIDLRVGRFHGATVLSQSADLNILAAPGADIAQLVERRIRNA